jgi:SAM-dependent methyltransferase
MNAYTTFAQVYDLFMDNVPYEEWSKYIISVLKEYGIHSGVICDLGCGTGKMTRLLAKAGYDMIGVDLSEDMLAIASGQNEEGILYLCQDMCELELYGTAKAMVSVCDSINYLLEEDEIVWTLQSVNRYLEPGGIFIFDFNTVYKYETVLGDTTICENREEGSFIWENYYDKEEQINEYDLTLFIREEEQLYRKFEETHYQRGYSLEQMHTLVEEAGMEFLAAYDAETKKSPTADSERIYIIAGEKGK